MSNLKSLPSVDQLLNTNKVCDFVGSFGRPLTLQAIRTTLDEVRGSFPIRHAIPDQESIIARVEQLLTTWTTLTLLPVINATGVILHTNLGRAPLSYDALDAIKRISINYSNLEYDLGKGHRGSRLIHAEDLLIRLTGAEAALVVNNNASAVLLILSALARRRRVVIARSQLVEIDRKSVV